LYVHEFGFWPYICPKVYSITFIAQSTGTL
jgi:hypothetical protein